MIKKAGLLTLIFCMLIGLFFALPIDADDEYMTCVVDEGTGQVVCDGNVTTMSAEELTKYESEGGAYKVPKGDANVQYYAETDDPAEIYTSADGNKKCYTKGGKIRNCYIKQSDGRWIQAEKSEITSDMQKSKGSAYVSSGGALYEALTGDVEELWSLDIKKDVAEPVAWIAKRASYIVIKSIGDDHQVFWNVPNVQQSAVNLVISNIPDGFTDGTYNVEDTEKLIAVGSHASKNNIMTNLGFYIPNYTYAGEFPVVYLSLNQVLPTSLWKAAWRYVRALVSGNSFIDAPNAETYNSMRYLGHDYTYPDENIVQFIEENWQTYFVDKLYSSSDTFRSYYNVSDSYLNVKGHIKTSSKDSKSTSDELATAGTISEEYISYDANQSSSAYIVEHFPRSYTKGESITNDPVYEVTMDQGSSTYGKINSHDAKYKYVDEIDDDHLHVEDVKNAITPQIELIIEDDRWKAVGVRYNYNTKEWEYDSDYNSIAAQRCILDSVSNKEITEKRDGEAEWEPTKSDKYHCSITGGSSSEYCYSYTRIDYDYYYKTYQGQPCEEDYYDEGDRCSIEEEITEWDFDTPAYEQDLNYYWNDSGGYTDYYKGKNQEINNIPQCIDQYIELYEKCVDGEFEDDDKKSICPIKVNKHGEHGDIYGSMGFATYTANVAGNIDREGDHSKGYSWTENIYTFYKRTNLETQSDTEFNRGRVSFKFFDRLISYTDTQGYNQFPMDEHIKTVGVDYHDYNSGGYNRNKKVVADFRDFMERWQKSLKKSEKNDKYIYYNQCLITSMNTGTCEGSDNSQLSVYNIYAQAQLYKFNTNLDQIAEDPKYAGMDPKEIRRQNAEKIVEKIQSTSGQYYSQVIDNLVQTMIQVANNNGHEIHLRDYVSKRVLPYNLSNMVEDNAELVGIEDPRFNASLVSRVFSNDLGDTAVDTLQRTLADKTLGIVGALSEICVVLVQWMSFDYLEQRGLSPASMWTSNLMELLMGLLAIYFILQLVMLAKKFINGNAGLAELMSRVLSFLLIFSILTFTYVNPEGLWGTLRDAMVKVMNLGEVSLLGQNEAYKSFLNGESDPEVIYWTPYFDAWSVYNTGYGILDAEQMINRGDGTPEVSTVNGKDMIPSNVKLWSVLLAKSFVRDSDNDRTSINNNAYRVVDHFMAPRVEATNHSISVTENENYNGQFQKSIVKVLPKILSTALILAIVAVKFMTFLYLWYMLYLLVFNILLSLSIKDNRDLKELFKNTFMPVFQMMVIGLWASLVIYASAKVTGIVGVVITLAFWYASILLFLSWKRKLGCFPPTMNWLYTIITALMRFADNLKKGE